MELRDYIIVVLHRHGIIKMSRTPLCLVDIVEKYLADPDSALILQWLEDVAKRRCVKKTVLLSQLRSLALSMGAKT